jgi:polyisoprenoid-binding protein YceI
MLETQLRFKSALKTRQQENGDYLFSLSLLLLLMTAFVYTPSSYAQENLSVSAKDSQATFAGVHVGMQFSGVFEKWNADIVLPPAASPEIIATFYVASAKTGDSTYDSTLPEGDWFDIENHPKSVFQSSQIVAKDKNYEVTGTLTLRGISQPVSFLLKNNHTTLTASFIIDRLSYNIGMESDPDAEWVNKEIKMTLTLQK